MRNLRHVVLSSTVALGITAVTLAGAGAAQAATPNTSVKTQVAKSVVSAKTMKTSANLHLRAKGTVKSKSLRVLSKGTHVTVLNKFAGWSKVKASGKTGWVSGKYLIQVKAKAKPPVKTSVKTMQTSANLNLRAKKTVKSKSLRVLSKGTKVAVLNKSAGWSQIKVSGKTGWVSGKYLIQVKAKAKTPVKKPTSNSTRTKIIANAKKHVGAKYKFGGTSPKTGWDCSGFVQYVFKESGVNVPRTKAWAGKTRVSRSAAKPGDLVVQRNGSHVGIYAGNRKMYHAANPKTGTVLAPDNYSTPTYYKVLSN